MASDRYDDPSGLSQVFAASSRTREPKRKNNGSRAALIVLHRIFAEDSVSTKFMVWPQIEILYVGGPNGQLF
jgi:hypothetical protein